MRRNPLTSAIVRIGALLVLLLSAAIYEARHLTVFEDYDIWWHLRTGAWILDNHAFPHVALFTQYASRPWIAYSWGFEVVAALGYKLLGLRGIAVLLVCFKVALAAIVFWMVRGSRRNFWPAILLAAIGLYAITDLKLRPGSLSMLFFAVELGLVFAARRQNRVRPLYSLPLLFAVWANVHIQFVYGLFVLALLLAAICVEQILRKLGWLGYEQREPALEIGPVTGLCVLSALATLLSPYSYHTYQVAWDYAHSSATYNYIVEMHAMNFRWTEHYVRLLLALAAFFALGQRRPRDLFSLMLLVAFALIGFRQQRDAWFLVLSSLAVIANAYASDAQAESVEEARAWRRELLVTAAVAVVALVIAIMRFIPSDRDSLLARVNQSFPVRACDAISRNQFPKPIFNPLNWGGFLTWYLPDYPVAIDGRTDLYGDEIVTRQFKVWDGAAPSSAEPTLMTARTLLLNRDSGLAQAVSESPGYQLVYGDDNAVVFVRTQP
jgi:hypothetical protein